MGSKDESIQVQEEMHSAVRSGDLYRVVALKEQWSLTEKENLYLLRHHFVPPKGYYFPSRVFGGKQRRFQMSWLDKYSGLVYSELKEGGHYRFCVLFARCESSVNELGVLVNQPLTNYYQKKPHKSLGSISVRKGGSLIKLL